MAESNKDHSWCVYALLCRGKYLYVGVTNDLEQRLRQHADGKGSKFVRSRRPFELAKVIWCESGSAARKMEYRLKRLRRAKKIKLLDIPI
jgi:putative endonuclease